ncbi:hypothetical protein SpCBS45565_g00021 [Spizellomyces sp. 'palustris']|nr:hypothetical protein SpCBS45565_g00021 [Spizellomyces sp. 'palustris']
MESATELLFSKGIPVRLKLATGKVLQTPSTTSGGQTGLKSTYGTEQYQEKRHPSITVQVALTTKNSGRLKVLEIQLTDESDPFFLYHLDVGEDDFHALKEEQNLLVDFQQFPVKFIELLEAVDGARREEQPKFIAQLTSDGSAKYAVFNVVETNTFRNITHISLHFIPGNDASVKQYLAQLVKEYKSDNASLKNQLDSTGSSLTIRLKESEGLNAKLTCELENIKLSNAEQMNRLQLQHAEALAREKEISSRQREEERIAAEKDKRSIEIQYEEQLKKLSQELASLKAAHSHMLSHAQSMETSTSNANKQIENLRQDLTITKQDLDKEIKLNEQLAHSKRDLEAECSSLRNKLRDIERDGRDKLVEEKRLEELLHMANEQKAKADDTLEMYKGQNARLDEALKQATEEINKGNEIIRRLQTDLKASKAKLKLKNVVTMQQEKLLDERAATVQGQQKELTDAKDTLSKVREELQVAQGRVEELTKQVQEGKAIIEDNNHVIEWLHKQMNEDALTRPLPTYTGSAPVLGGYGLDRHAAGTCAAQNATYKPHSPTGYRSRYVSGVDGQSSTGGPAGGLASTSRSIPRPVFPHGAATEGTDAVGPGKPTAISSRVPSPPKTTGSSMPRFGGGGLGSSMGGLVSGVGGAERYVNKGAGGGLTTGPKSNYFGN